MSRNDLIKEVIRILHKLTDILRGADIAMLDYDDLDQIQYDLLQLSSDGTGNKPIIETTKHE